MTARPRKDARVHREIAARSQAVTQIRLLVYVALELRIREALQQQNETFPNQKGKPATNPTAAQKKGRTTHDATCQCLFQKQRDERFRCALTQKICREHEEPPSHEGDAKSTRGVTDEATNLGK